MGFASLSSHQDVLTEALDRWKQRFEGIASQTDVDISFASGLQAGMSRRLRVSRLRIGAGEDNDVVLLDSGVAATQAEVSLTRSMFGALAEVRALAPGVNVDGAPLAAGSAIAAKRLPFEIDVAGTRLVIARVGSTCPSTSQAVRGQMARIWRPKGDPILLVALAALVLTLLGTLVATVLTPDRSLVTRNDSTALIPQVNLASTRDWPVALRAELAAADLESVLAVKSAEDGLLTVAGTVPEARIEDLRRVQSWFYAQADAPAVVWDIRRNASLGAVPLVGMVRFSAPAAVILRNGKTVAVGEPLLDDWILESVAPGTMTITREGERRTLNYRG